MADIVDTSKSKVDSTFATTSLKCQPNYAIGVFKDDKLMLTPLKNFHQVRPSFDHIDEAKQRNTIQTSEQIKAEQKAANELKRVGMQSAG